MPRFQLYIASITCNAITDSYLEGNQDELYIQIWHQRYSSVIVKKKIVLGNFVPSQVKIMEELVFEEEYPDIDTLGFDFYDSDIFSANDLIGGFILGVPNNLRAGMYTALETDPESGLTTFFFTGNDGDYVVKAAFSAL